MENKSDTQSRKPLKTTADAFLLDLLGTSSPSGCEFEAQAVIEKHHQQGLVLAQMLPLETVFLYLYGLLQSLVQIAEVLYVQK